MLCMSPVVEQQTRSLYISPYVFMLRKHIDLNMNFKKFRYRTTLIRLAHFNVFENNKFSNHISKVILLKAKSYCFAR